MISHGDELGRTSRAITTPTARTIRLTWIDWRLSPLQRELLQFTRTVFAIRAANPVLRRRTFFRHEVPQERPRT